MKRTFQPHLVLTLFMLVVVMAAAFFFLFRSWRIVADEAAAANAYQAAAATAAAERDTAVDTVSTLEMQLVESQQDNDQLAADLAAAREALDQFAAESGEETMRVFIANPANESAVLAGTAVEVIALALDAAGVETVEMNINGEVSRLRTGGTTTLERLTWLPEELGPATIVVTATNSARQTATAVSEIIVEPAPSTPQEEAPAEGTAVVAANMIPFTTTLQAGESVTFAIFAVDTAGITQVRVTADDIEIISLVADEEPYRVEQANWTPEAAGEYETVIEIENINGETTSWPGPTLTVTAADS